MKSGSSDLAMLLGEHVVCTIIIIIIIIKVVLEQVEKKTEKGSVN